MRLTSWKSSFRRERAPVSMAHRVAAAWYEVEFDLLGDGWIIAYVADRR
jgi:hypothetical protein